MRSNRTAFERVDLCDILNLHQSTSCFASQKEYIRTFYALLVTNFDPKWNHFGGQSSHRRYIWSSQMLTTRNLQIRHEDLDEDQERIV